MQSLEERLYTYLKRHEGVWYHKDTLEELAKSAGYSYENAGRRLRELAECGRIDREQRKGKRVKSVWYCVPSTI